MDAHVDLYWLPLGAGDANRCVRLSGRAFEAMAAQYGHRATCELYHSALTVRYGGDHYVIEMAPVWQPGPADRGVVGEGPVGLPWLGRSRVFRYEVRRWRGGTIPDLAEAVASPLRLSADAERARLLLDLVPDFPAATWGLDELRTGDMWNSNSLVSWLLVGSGHPIGAVEPPAGGRAPGWHAGITVAHRRRQRMAAPGTKGPEARPATALRSGRREGDDDDIQRDKRVGPGRRSPRTGDQTPSEAA